MPPRSLLNPIEVAGVLSELRADVAVLKRQVHDLMTGRTPSTDANPKPAYAIPEKKLAPGKAKATDSPSDEIAPPVRDA